MFFLNISEAIAKTNENNQMTLLIECHVGSTMYSVYTYVFYNMYMFLKLLDVQELRMLRGCASAYAHTCINASTVALTRVNVIIN